MKLDFSSPKLLCRGTPVYQHMHIVLPSNILALPWNQCGPLQLMPSYSSPKNFYTQRWVSLQLGSRRTLVTHIIYICLSQEQVKLNPVFPQENTDMSWVLCLDIIFCLPHIRELHAGSNAFTLGTNSHAKAFFHLTKRVIHATAFPFPAAIFSNKEPSKQYTPEWTTS